MILGGLGFSGYNEEFNANDGVYRATVDRNTEIQESKKFEQLYDKLTDVLAKKIQSSLHIHQKRLVCRCKVS